MKKIKVNENQFHKLLAGTSSKPFSDINAENIDKGVDTYNSGLLDEELNNLCVIYSQEPHVVTYGNPLSIMMSKSINEGLIKTYPLDNTVSYIKNYFGLDDRQVVVQKVYNNQPHILIRIPAIGDNVEMIKKAMNLCGYYLAAPKDNEIEKDKWIWLQFEAKVEKDISEQLRKEESFLTHFTPYYNVDKILKQGLSPKSKNSILNYPGRIYLMRGSLNKESTKDLGMQLFMNNKSKGNDGKYVLLVIDLSKIPENTPFHFDPNYPYGVYTQSNIRPDAIVEAIPFLFK